MQHPLWASIYSKYITNIPEMPVLWPLSTVAVCVPEIFCNNRSLLQNGSCARRQRLPGQVLGCDKTSCHSSLVLGASVPRSHLPLHMQQCCSQPWHLARLCLKPSVQFLFCLKNTFIRIHLLTSKYVLITDG